MSLYQVSKAVMSLFRAATYDYCNLEAPDGDSSSTVMATKDNGLCSMFEVHGTFQHTGAQRLAENIASLFKSTKSGLKGIGQRIDVVYIRDKDRGAEVAKLKIAPLRKAMNQRHLDLNFFLDEQEDSLSKDLVYEKVYVIITTNLISIDKTRQEEALNRREERAKKLDSTVFSGDYCQNLLAPIEALRSTHDANVESLHNALNKISSNTRLSCKAMVQAIRMESAPDFTGERWQPRMVGDRLPIRSTKESPNSFDISHIAYPSIGYQLFPMSPEPCKEDRSLVQIGSAIHAPLLVDTPPASPEPFPKLIAALPKEVPVRLVFTLETGHDQVLSKVHGKKNKAMILAWSSSQTKGIVEAANEIIDTATRGDIYAAATISACTWGNDVKEAQRNKNILAKTLQNWGGIEVIEEKADSPRAWATTLPGFSHPGLRLASEFPYPIADIFSILPLDRVTSPFDGGPVLCRSLSDTLYSISPTSSRQDTWIDYFFAPPGRGKSVTMSYHNLSFLLNPIYKTLPSIAILDIGPSAENTIRLIQEALPDDQKHIAASFKLRMRKDSAINPFDTPLGCRRPILIDQKVLLRIVEAVLSPTGALANIGIPMLSEFCSLLVERMYVHYSDEPGLDGKPKIYEEGKDETVDESLVRYGIPVKSGSSTWWSIVDRLFEKDDYAMAIRAQRFAVPTLNDASEVMSEDAIIRRSFEGVKVNGDQSLFDYVNTMLRTAARDLPVLASETAFDIGNARIIALDLAEVTPQGSQDFEVKQTSIMYLLGRYAVSRNFYRNNDTVDEIPEAYRAYHQREIDDLTQAPKRLMMDEIHRCVKFNSVLSQLVLDCREGRKFDVQISLASQRLDDLPDELVDLVQNFYVMSLGNDQVASRIIKKLNIHPDVAEAMNIYCQGPGKRGLYHLVLSQIRDEGDSEDNGSKLDHIVNLKQGTMMLLGQSTTAEDRNVRTRLVRLVGLSSALRMMAKEFPGGKVKPYIENMTKQGAFDDLKGNLYDHLCAEIVRKHGHLAS